VIFGHFGDRLGRKNMLVMTLMIMGVATFLIGLLPTYQEIGVLAPILMLMLRVLQGIGLGGEWGGAVLMTYEYAEPGRRGLYASLPQIGLSIGLCLASGVVALFSYILDDAQFLTWGWRVAFVLSVILVVIGIYIRLRIFETPEFAALKEKQGEARMPFLDMIKEYPANILAGMGARYIDGVFFNIFAVFMIGYLVNTLNIARTDALLGVMLAALVMCVFIPIFGHLSDRHGRGRVYWIGALVTGLSAFPAMWLILNSAGNVGLIWLAIVVPFGIFYAACYGPEAALFSDLFETRVRYTGVSFVYQFSGIFASGLTPLIATALLPLNGGRPWLICAYILFSALVSAASARWIEQRAKAGELMPAKQVGMPM
jgi:MFS transporter, MHS family, shikimate and dehydroshikimate transport protein